MTLVVGKISGRRIAVVSDTQISQLDMRLPIQDGVIKTYILTGGICVSFSNSPELAIRDLSRFVEAYPKGTGFQETVRFFKQSSSETGNDYLIAFAQSPRLVTIANGERVTSAARTQWIGDSQAYVRFREHEAKQRKSYEAGRAVNAVLFADEMEGSPASDLYSSMRHVTADPQIASVGGFAYVVSDRDGHFRQSIYCDMLFDWPEGRSEDYMLQLTEPIDFGASGENQGFSISQASPGYMNLNVAVFYVLTARKIFIYSGDASSPLMRCHVVNNVAPTEIKGRLNEFFGQDLGWLIQVLSAAPDRSSSRPRTSVAHGEPNGVGFKFFCHENTYPKKPTA